MIAFCISLSPGTKPRIAADFQFFTAQEMIDNIIVFERIDRPKTSWFGGVDCHHVYFEGLRPDEKGSYHLFWGS